MTKIVFGKLLSGDPAEIRLTDAEVQAFDRADSYLSRLLILRRAGFRQRMVSMLLTADGVLTSNLNCREPGPGEETVWLKAGEHSEFLDRSPRIELGEQAVALLGIRGSHPKPVAPDTELLQWLDPLISVTAQDLALCMGISRSAVQKRLTAMCAIGAVRRNGPSDRHNPVRWYLADDEDQVA